MTTTTATTATTTATMIRRSVSKPHMLYLASQRRAQMLWSWVRGPGRHSAVELARRALEHIGQNLAPRRLLSFPHALVLAWLLILLRGEIWVFDKKVGDCDWKRWEKWPKGASPHHLILVADPQIIDAHSYPGRPWPLSALTVLITDNYMRRGFAALERQLHPDSLFFLGDLFDGGREWKTRLGGFVDPSWGRDRSRQEKKWVKTWHRKYGDDYWLREYRRFQGIFTDFWNKGDTASGPWQRGRKFVTSLPGNHDLGFGAQIQVPVRDRFRAYFGETNRVDVIGNHTVVSVDTVSLSADTSSFKDKHDLKPIYGPVQEFLGRVQSAKRKAVQGELQAWFDDAARPRFDHKVEPLASAGPGSWPSNGNAEGADWPTILLTHVPLYREPGTPCGPLRERWPPTRPPKGQKGPVIPDHRNSISVTAGYQYQNVLGQEDSAKLVGSVGNVSHVFSGDDHDYCELVHSESQGGVREITVKSFSMAMGVTTPGFVMVSLYRPVGADGKPLPGTPEQTLQTHLCLLPNQMRTYIRYGAFIILSLVALAARALLVPVVGLQPFALEPDKRRAAVLPMYREKAKAEPPVVPPRHGLPGRAVAAEVSGSRSGGAATDRGARWPSSKKKRQARRWGWAGDEGGPRIKLDSDFYDGGQQWKRAGGGRRALGTFGREMWTTTWRVAWMTVLIWAYLARRG